MAARAVYTIPRSKQRQYLLVNWLPGLLTGMFGIGLVIYFFWLRPNQELMDVIGAKTEHCLCTVNEIVYLPVTSGNTNPAILATVDIAGDDVTFRTHANLHRNQDIQVTYRIGRSGDIHIDDIKPTNNYRNTIIP